MIWAMRLWLPLNQVPWLRDDQSLCQCSHGCRWNVPHDVYNLVGKYEGGWFFFTPPNLQPWLQRFISWHKKHPSKISTIQKWKHCFLVECPKNWLFNEFNGLTFFSYGGWVVNLTRNEWTWQKDCSELRRKMISPGPFHLSLSKHDVLHPFLLIDQSGFVWRLTINPKWLGSIIYSMYTQCQGLCRCPCMVAPSSFSYQTMSAYHTSSPY